jgi:hypothetical protein
MRYQDIDYFLTDLSAILTLLFEGKIDFVIEYKRLHRASLRILFSKALYIDIYANTDNQRYDFSLIKNHQRIFGIDNLGGWHSHPLNNEKKHVALKKEPNLKTIFSVFAKTAREVSG